VATTSDISPYLQRPVRRLEDALAEVEQQRVATPGASVTVVFPSATSGNAPTLGGSTNKERI